MFSCNKEKLFVNLYFSSYRLHNSTKILTSNNIGCQTMLVGSAMNVRKSLLPFVGGITAEFVVRSFAHDAAIV